MEKGKRGKKNPSVIPVHTGKLLNEKIKELRMTKSTVARLINRPPQAIKPLLARPSMQAYLLWELSIAMRFDFFASFSEALHQKQPDIKSPAGGDKLTITTLQNELAALRDERDYLKKMIDIMAR